MANKYGVEVTSGAVVWNSLMAFHRKRAVKGLSYITFFKRVEGGESPHSAARRPPRRYSKASKEPAAPVNVEAAA